MPLDSIKMTSSANWEEVVCPNASPFLAAIESSRNLSPIIETPKTIVVSAVMPCLNEERTLGACIEKAWTAFRELGVQGEVVVGDNGSTDRSVEIAKKLGARVVNVPTRGYGAALTAAIEAATGTFVVMADADDSYDWLGLGPFIAKLEDGHDLVIGNRFQGGIEPGAMPKLHRYLGNPVLSWLARAVHGARIGDFHCGMRAFRRDTFGRMNCRTDGMEFATEMIVNAMRAGLRITEVPTRLRRDGRDRPPHLRSFRDGWRHLRFIFTYAPNQLYLVPGGALFCLGASLVAALAGGPITLAGHYIGIHFLALGALLTLVGFNIVNLGLLAKVVVAARHPHHPSTVMRWLRLSFSLEAGLIVGLALAIAGIGIDARLLIQWLAHPDRSMESSEHLGFVATLMIVVGLNVVFGSFLLAMLVDDRREKRDVQGPRDGAT